jgi:hypothetical protein
LAHLIFVSGLVLLRVLVIILTYEFVKRKIGRETEMPLFLLSFFLTSVSHPKLRKPAEGSAAEEARKPVCKAAEAAVERLAKEKSWGAWQLKAEAELYPVNQEKIFQAGLEDFPQSHELIGNFALFMENVRQNLRRSRAAVSQDAGIGPFQQVGF